MKRMRYMVGMLLACVLVSCEEKLPEFDITTVTIRAEWQEHDLHLSSGLELAEGIDIKEQGFVLELPVLAGGVWVDYEREQRTVKVPAGESLAYTLLSEGWKEGLTCTAFAYIVTNSGKYRSDKVEITTRPGAPEPVFTQVTHQPSAEGPYYGGGTVIVEGKHFNGNTSGIFVRVGGYHATVVGGSPGRVVARYPVGIYQQAGDYEVKVIYAEKEYTLAQKMVIDGIRILSTEPEHPRHGEPVKMYLENYTPGHIMDVLSGFWNVEIEVMEEGEGYVTFRTPVYPVGRFEVALLGKDAIRSKPHVLEVAPSWEELDLAQAGWPEKSFGYQSSWTHHDGKTYLTDTEHTALMVFDSATLRWKSVAYPDVPNRTEYWMNEQLFGYKNHLYLFVRINQWNTGVVWQYLYRMDVDTCRWELVEEVDPAVLKGDYVRFAVTDEGVAYALREGEKLMEYDLENLTWKESAHSLPHSAVLIGGRGSKVYYRESHIGGMVCGVDLASGAQPERMMPEYSRQFFVLDDDYLYYQREYAFYRMSLSNPGAGEEFLGTLGLPAFEYDWGNGYLLPASGVPCLIWNTPSEGAKLYRYLPE